MANPDYLEFLERQTRLSRNILGMKPMKSNGEILPEVKRHQGVSKMSYDEFSEDAVKIPKKPATIVDMSSPLDVFPSDDPEKQDGNITNLTS